MRYLKMLGLAAVSATALMALVGASSASATTLEIEGVTKNESLSGSISLANGTSIILKDTSGFAQNTCQSSSGEASTSSPYTGEFVTGVATSGSFSNCTRTVTVHNPGKAEIFWTSGTNGTVYGEGGEITSGSPFGTLTCKSGETTHIGTLTGVSSGNATLHVNAVINCGSLSSAKVEATYTITNHSGLGVSS
jgi:hypothetical protein